VQERDKKRKEMHPFNVRNLNKSFVALKKNLDDKTNVSKA